ncbi:GNAT family N-acetyltransferase [Undibacterium sp. RuTC16W]|uniref:GNAT family N-acetyltransferase n=1 Tax=Undibacterium sp. RuTC16W TaxID=3413048 RepID=UPI003BF43D19
MNYRLMQAADLPAVYAIQNLCYVSAMVEPLALLQSRWRSAPDTSWVAEDEQGICAYLFAYPSIRGKITRLGADFAIAAAPDCLYLHDLAVAPRAAGQGAGAGLVQTALQNAMGLRYSCLVSVQSTRQFWQRQGYTEQTELDQEQQACLETYTGPASYWKNL